MIWKQATDTNGKPTAYGLVSACERFRIGKFLLPQGTVYKLFDGLTPVGIYQTANEAKKNRREPCGIDRRLSTVARARGVNG